MSAMIENAVTWHELATECFEKYVRRSEETRYLRACCNHMQQAAEFAIKGTLELLGRDYYPGHDLEQNADLLIETIEKKSGENAAFSPLKGIIGDLKWLSDKSGIIIKWEQKPRYDGENFYANEENVRKCKECLDRIIPVISDMI
ncbi:MAG: HEPN domain-containing protein [Lachnospiraceae bacterium]|nr:HEPN domain-containing protein [Lachnospiraceae bacterium]